jgi:hypothetical protein
MTHDTHYFPDAGDAAFARTQSLLARPDVAALIEQATHLSDGRRAALDRAWSANYGLHRLAQMRAVHDLRRAFIARDGDDRGMRDIQAVGEVLCRLLDPRDDRWFGMLHATYDVVLTLAAGDLLGGVGRTLLDGPWRSVVMADGGYGETFSTPLRRAA